MLLQSWNVNQGQVNLYSGQEGFFAEFESGHKIAMISAHQIEGLSELADKSSSVCQAYLNDTYARVTPRSDESFSLRISPRLKGGGGGNSKPDSSHNTWSELGKEAAEHTVMHGIGHAVGGPVGGFFAGLLHTSELGRSETPPHILDLQRQQQREHQAMAQDVLNRHFSQYNSSNFPSFPPKPPFHQ